MYFTIPTIRLKLKKLCLFLHTHKSVKFDFYLRSICGVTLLGKKRKCSKSFASNSEKNVYDKQLLIIDKQKSIFGTILTVL